MSRLLRNLLSFRSARALVTSRVGLALWGWRNRYRLLDWAGFGLRAVGDLAGGNGTADARAELRLRTALMRDSMTRGAAVDVSVDGGVCRLEGKASPEVHARIQDKAAGVAGIDRIDDRIVTVSPRNRRFRLRAA